MTNAEFMRSADNKQLAEMLASISIGAVMALVDSVDLKNVDYKQIDFNRVFENYRESYEKFLEEESKE